jgi:hypothetical protein
VILALELLAAAMFGAVVGALMLALCIAAHRGDVDDDERLRRAGL